MFTSDWSSDVCSSDLESHVLVDKGTEPPFSGEYTNLKDAGTFICRRCNAALYHSHDKLESHCGWPRLDDEIPDAVERQADADGRSEEGRGGKECRSGGPPEQ